ncbi:unnamed protein product, partial [Brassica oleracea]
MAPKTRFAGKTNKEGAPEKKKKNKSAAEKKKVAAVKRRREAVKKKEMQQRRKLKPQKRRGSKTRLRRSLHPIKPSGVGPHLHQNNIPIPIIPRHHQRNCFLRMIERKQGLRVTEADGEEEADKDGKNSESDAITAAVHTPLPTETTPEDAEGEEEAAKEAYEVAGNEDEVGQKEGETEADKEG